MHEALKRTFSVYEPTSERDEYGAPVYGFEYVRDIAAVLSFDSYYRDKELAVDTATGKYIAVTDACGLRRGMVLENGGRRYAIDYVNGFSDRCELYLTEQYERE